MEEALARQIVFQARFDGVELRDVLDFVRDVSSPYPPIGGGLRRPGYVPPPLPPWDIDINWRAIHDSGVSLDAPVTLALPRSVNGRATARLPTVGQLLVEVTGAAGLSCSADASLIRISTADELRRPRVVERSRLFPLRSPADRLADAALDTPLPQENPGMRDMMLHDALQILSDVTRLKIRVD